MKELPRITRHCVLVLLTSAACNTLLAADTAMPAAATPEAALTLSRAIELALAGNPGLRAGSARVAAASGRAYQARQWTNPEFELASEDIPVRTGSFRDSKNTVGLSQTLPWPGKKRLDGRIGAAGVRLSEAELNLRKLELIRDVKVSFYCVIAYENLTRVGGSLAELAESSAGAARKRVEAGAAPDQEQLRAEIQLEQARAEVAVFRREAGAARQELARLLGRPELEGILLSGNLAEKPEVPVTEKVKWLEQHPGLVAARTLRDQAELELRRARLEPYPDVRVGVDGGREGRDDNAIVQFRVSLPLPVLDTSKGRKAEAQANLEVTAAELETLELQLLRDWSQAHQRFHTAAEQAASYRERIVPKAVRALELVQTGFDEGRFDFIDLLDTQRTTAEARLAYQQKLLELNIAYAELEGLLAQAPR